MLDRIIKYALNNKFLVLLSFTTLIVFGIWTAIKMEVDVFPDLTAPTVVIMTDAHGLAPEEVETLVTFPLETSVNGARDVRRVRSVSSQGFSFVWVDFDWGTDVFAARQIVGEKIQMVASQMPEGVDMPELAPQSSVMGEIFFIGLQADSTDMMELRTMAEWVVKPMILSTGGVSNVTIIGGDFKQYHVLADPQKMKYFDVCIDDLKQICKGMSRNSSGNILREFGNEYVIRGIARTSNLDDLGNSLIKSRNGKPVRIRDVADVEIGSAVRMGYASSNAKPAIILSVSKQPNINTLKVTEEIEAKLEDLRTSIPPDVVVNTEIFRQADFIERSIKNIQNALIEGSILIIIILLLFLGSFRTTLISLLAIPISLIGSILVLRFLGMNINTMSLGGMAIAIGSLVDDAIIDVENVFKRLRQNRKKREVDRESSFDVVFKASKEIRASILNATLIIMVAFMPLFFLSGMEGRMLKPLGISFIVSLFVSLIVAMTLTPLLAKLLLSNDRFLKKNEKEKWLSKMLSKYYERSLLWALKWRKVILAFVVLLLIGSIYIFSGFGRSFLPKFNEGALTISMVTQPGTSLEESNKIGMLAENELLSIDEIFSTARRTGRGELDEHSQTVNSAEIDVNFTLGERNQEEFLEDVRHKLSGIPGIAVTVGQPLSHRIDHMLSGTRANIAIKVFGTQLNTLFTIGNEIKETIDGIDGLVDVNVDQLIEIPQIQIRPNRNLLAYHGITIEHFNDFVDVAIGGEKMGDIYEGPRNFDLILRYNDKNRASIEGIKSALIDNQDGKKVPLAQVAEVVSVSGPSSISRENVQRKIVVSGNVAGSDIHTIVNEIKSRIDTEINLPEAYRIEYGGQFESEARASRTLLFTSLLAIAIIFLLLFQEFRSFKLAGIILLNLPLALIGGVFSIYISSGALSIPAIIGFITLFGIATRNGILLISNYQKLEKKGVELSSILLQGSSDRLNAILMTALTAALALLPLAFQGHLPGNEIQSPMAKVILGGLLTSTILNIYIIPIVYRSVVNRGIVKSKK